ncbi:hypothetical protein FA95DRAFT_1565280 [Auriscalpium vulgare]|uniref:Uncharacterized protein n=1 Tax=Auriscalpium vulgare TaxID=40419 RepID=A0ACB8RBW7_9AGAM|nr:hypothetical protein FA95DRAFT_1565280 [Auriscalpium vulgare]
MSAGGKMPWMTLITVSAGLIGGGYALMKVTVPTPEQTYNAMAPDLRRKVDANRRAREALEQGMKRQNEAQAADPDTAKPVWASPPTA